MTTISSPLHVNDLVLMRNIIDVALSRGAFRGDEIGPVSEVYTKLTNFIETVAQTAEEEAADSDEEITEVTKDEAGE